MVEVVVWRYTSGSERESEKGVCVYEKKKKKCKDHLLWPAKKGDKGVWCVVVVNGVGGACGGSKKSDLCLSFFSFIELGWGITTGA